VWKFCIWSEGNNITNISDVSAHTNRSF